MSKQSVVPLYERDEAWRTLFSVLPVGVSLLDKDHKMVDFNPALGSILGITPEGLRTGAYKRWKFLRSDGSIMPPNEFPSVRAESEQKIIPAVIIGVQKEDGDIVWTEVCAAPLHLPGMSSVIVTRNVTERIQLTETLRTSELQYKAIAIQLEGILDHIPGLVYYKDKRNNFIRVNKYFAEAIKKDKKQLEGASLYDLYTKVDADRYYDDDLAVINSGKAKLNIEEPWTTPDGLRWVNSSKIPFVDDNGEIIGVIGISIDITDRKHDDQLIQELIHRLELEKDYAQKSALTDGLTRISNRRHFDDILVREFARLKRSNGVLSLIMMDIDYFKKYNDTFGHIAGDECLRKVAAAIQIAIGRAPDFAARYGGEEFVVILPETGKHGAKIVADRIRRSVEDLAIPHQRPDNTSVVTLSLGVVTVHPDHVESPEMVIALADQALYHAKENGRNRFEMAPGADGLGDGNYNAQSGFIRLVWHAADECGNAIIDLQHKMLFDSSNNLLSALIAGKPHAECYPLIDKLLKDISKHFSDEEEILRQIGYPLANEHHHAHEGLVKKAQILAERFQKEGLPIAELFNFLAFEIISQHMFIEDKRYFPYVQT